MLWAGALEQQSSLPPHRARLGEAAHRQVNTRDPKLVPGAPQPELTPCPAAASPHQRSPELIPHQPALGLEVHSRNGAGGWINPTGGRDPVEWWGDAGTESIYHALEARSTLIAHEAL